MTATTIIAAITEMLMACNVDMDGDPPFDAIQTLDFRPWTTDFFKTFTNDNSSTLCSSVCLK